MLYCVLCVCDTHCVLCIVCNTVIHTVYASAEPKAVVDLRLPSSCGQRRTAVDGGGRGGGCD